MRLLILTLFCALIAALAAPGRAECAAYIQGQIVSTGTAPFTENWDQMLARERAAARRSTLSTMGQPPAIAAPRPWVPKTVTVPQTSTNSISPAAASILSPQTVGTGFIGITMQDEFTNLGAGDYPPDTMGAIGPNHFMVLINGVASVFTRTGTRLSFINLDTFFTFTVGGTTYPRNGTTDPRIIYDRHSGRWFASALEFGNPSQTDNHIVFAVCRTNDPLNGAWDKYLIPIGRANSGSRTFFSDYDTLGLDDNGVYFAATIFSSSGSITYRIAATPKAPLIAASPSLGTVTQFTNISDFSGTPYSAYNLDSVAPTGRAWFVSSSNTTTANINYRTLSWSGGVPVLSSPSSVLSTPSYGNPIDAPASGSTTNIDAGDDRLMVAFIRGHKLWTGRDVGVNSSGGASGADRGAAEWLELDVSSPTATLVQSGRIYDNAATNPRFYFYPSIAVNGRGDAVVGFSGSKSTEFVGAYSCGRLASDPLGAMGTPTLLKAGEASYNRVASGVNRWGDFSYTSVDPNDDMSIWTTQEYATSVAADIWGTWIAKMLSTPPTLNNPAGSGCPGHTAVSLPLTGTGFYDPGPGFPDRLSVTLTGGAVNGIGNYSVAYQSSTSVLVTFDIAANASPGPRDIVLTNPDGQSAAAISGFTVNSPTVINTQPQSVVACLGDPVTFCVAATGGGTLTYQWNKDGVPIPGATASCYTIPAAALLDAGSYTCTITDDCGSTPSAAASLGVGPCSSILAAKLAPEGELVAIKGRAVTAGFTDFFYIEESDRTSGIRVNLTASSLTAGTVVDIVGLVHTNADGERCVDATQVVPSTSSSVSPYGMTGTAVGGADLAFNPIPPISGQQGVLGGQGPNNIGLLVRCWGAYAPVDASTFTIDDGSGTPIKCIAAPGVVLGVWNYVVVTGASSCQQGVGGLVRVIRIPSQSSIQPLQ